MNRKESLLLMTVIVAIGLGVLSACGGKVVGGVAREEGMTVATIGPTTATDTVTYIEVTPDQLLSGYQQYLGKEVIFTSIVSSKTTTCAMIACNLIRINPDDLSFLNYLALTDTVQVHGVVKGMENGVIILDDTHINIWFSCYPREHTANDIGNDGSVQTADNGIDGYGWGS